MQNILFLNSYSERATSHYQFALRVARTLDATLHLAHVYDFRTDMPPAADFEAREEELNEWLLKEQRRESLELETFVQENTSKQHHSLIGLTHVFEGSAIEQVPRLLETTTFDLVVMGMQAHSLLGDVLATNLTQYLVDTAKCPLLLLPPKQLVTPIKRICFATDLKDGTVDAVNYLFDLSLRLNAAFHLLTVVTDHGDVTTAEGRITTLQKSMHGGFTSKLPYEIEVGDVEEQISNHIAENDTDLLVLTTLQRKRWLDQFDQTVTKALVREAEVPLLILKEDYVVDYQV